MNSSLAVWRDRIKMYLRFKTRVKTCKFSLDSLKSFPDIHILSFQKMLSFLFELCIKGLNLKIVKNNEDGWNNQKITSWINIKSFWRRELLTNVWGGEKCEVFVKKSYQVWHVNFYTVRIILSSVDNFIQCREFYFV